MATSVVCHWQAADVRVGDVVDQADRMRCQEERTATRASVVNLVVVAGDARAAERARSAVAGLGVHHPGRIIIIRPRPDAGDGIDAEIELQETGLAERNLWWEVISLEVRGAAATHLPSLVEPLLLHDLPVAAWHTGRVPTPADMVTAAAHLLLDAEPGGGDARASRLDEIAGLLRVRPVTDLEWLAVEPWRRALARLFDPPSRRSLLAGPASVEVSGPGWPALLLGGWLADRLGLASGQVRIRAGEPATTIDLTVGGRRVSVRADDAGQVTAGLDGEPPASGGAVPAGTAEVLGAALARSATDPIYARALAGAARLAP